MLGEGEMKNINMESDEELNIVFILNNYKSTITHVRGSYLFI